MWKRVLLVWAVVRDDLRLLWFALRHPRAPRWFKIGVVAVALYLVSPIDLISDAIPVAGLLDDIIIVPFAIRWLLGRLPADLRAEAEMRAGLASSGVVYDQEP
jgi:uncharacterized membrane protein YkvA (DUF1232 family)